MLVCYFDFFAASAGRATPHGSYFSFGSGILLQRGLVGLLVDLRPARVGFLLRIARMPLAVQLGCAGAASKASATAAIVKAFIAVSSPLGRSPAGMSQSNCGKACGLAGTIPHSAAGFSEC